MLHDRSGMTGAFIKNEDAPADQERKLGIVNSETVTNWTKVIRGPAAGSSLLYSSVGHKQRVDKRRDLLDNSLQSKNIPTAPAKYQSPNNRRIEPFRQCRKQYPGSDARHVVIILVLSLVVVGMVVHYDDLVPSFLIRDSVGHGAFRGGRGGCRRG